MGQLLQDLRFIIGLFFLTTGGVLTAQGLIDGPIQLSVANLNLGSGLAMLVFAVAMLTLSVLTPAPATGGH